MATGPGPRPELRVGPGYPASDLGSPSEVTSHCHGHHCRSSCRGPGLVTRRQRRRRAAAEPAAGPRRPPVLRLGLTVGLLRGSSSSHGILNLVKLASVVLLVRNGTASSIFKSS